MRGGVSCYIPDNAMIVRVAAAAPVLRRARLPLKGLDVDATSRPGKDRSRRKPAAGGHHARRPSVSREQPPGGLYGALDLGTNNCRLLIATPTQNGFSVVDAFSRIVRLGERLAQTGRLSDDAMGRTIDALRVCANKLRWRKVDRVRLVATEACRMAENGPAFIARVKSETGLGLEIIDRETEAGLAAVGAEPLVDSEAETALVFDIGGGSTEVLWMRRSGARFETVAWTSLAAGVVTISERFGGGVDVTPVVWVGVVSLVRELLVGQQGLLTLALLRSQSLA